MAESPETAERKKAHTKAPRIFLLMNKAHAALARATERRTQDVAGLSMAQHGVLFLLSQADGQTVTDLARGLSMRKSSLSGLIDRMVDRAFVSRRADPDDGRVVRIWLQDPAWDHLRRVGPLVKTMNGALLAGFDPGEQQVIARFLTHLIDHSEDIIADISVEHCDERQ